MAHKKHVLICGGTGCLSSKSKQIAENMNVLLKEKGLEDEVKVVLTGCFGFCEKGPIVKIIPENTFYVEVKPEDASRILEEDII
ncbi:MAG: (2Fe-2S) ferredoxin domain-containing protein, partial [Fusobacteriaceae bacterium]